MAIFNSYLDITRGYIEARDFSMDNPHLQDRCYGSTATDTMAPISRACNWPEVVVRGEFRESFVGKVQNGSW